MIICYETERFFKENFMKFFCYDCAVVKLGTFIYLLTYIVLHHIILGAILFGNLLGSSGYVRGVGNS